MNQTIDMETVFLQWSAELLPCCRLTAAVQTACQTLLPLPQFRAELTKREHQMNNRHINFAYLCRFGLSFRTPSHFPSSLFFFFYSYGFFFFFLLCVDWWLTNQLRVALPPSTGLSVEKGMQKNRIYIGFIKSTFLFITI